MIFLSFVYPAYRNVELVRHSDRLGEETNKSTESKGCKERNNGENNLTRTKKKEIVINDGPIALYKLQSMLHTYLKFLWCNYVTTSLVCQ